MFDPNQLLVLAEQTTTTMASTVAVANATRVIRNAISTLYAKTGEKRFPLTDVAIEAGYKGPGGKVFRTVIGNLKKIGEVIKTKDHIELTPDGIDKVSKKDAQVEQSGYKAPELETATLDEEEAVASSERTKRTQISSQKKKAIKSDCLHNGEEKEKQNAKGHENSKSKKQRTQLDKTRRARRQVTVTVSIGATIESDEHLHRGIDTDQETNEANKEKKSSKPDRPKTTSANCIATRKVGTTQDDRDELQPPVFKKVAVKNAKTTADSEVSEDEEEDNMPIVELKMFFLQKSNGAKKTKRKREELGQVSQHAVDPKKSLGSNRGGRLKKSRKELASMSTSSDEDV